jgi:hypothetical protein
MDRASADPRDPLSAPKRPATQRADARDVSGRCRSNIAADSIGDAVSWMSPAFITILAGHRRSAKTRSDLVCDVLQS